jgi:hypothetical protein
MRKAWIADAFQAAGRERRLRLDISLEAKDTLVGDDWFRFLLRSRYTIGVESGAGILDRDGRIRACADAFVAERPTATFEEVERGASPDDGNLNLNDLAAAPEACATRTPQIWWKAPTTGFSKRPALPPSSRGSWQRGRDRGIGPERRRPRDMAERACTASWPRPLRLQAFADHPGGGGVSARGQASRRGILIGGLSAWEGRSTFRRGGSGSATGPANGAEALRRAC